MPLTLNLLIDAAATVAEEFVERPGATMRPPDPAAEETESALDRLGTGGVTLKGTLGAGGMAIVHLGLQESVDREVAVKTLKDSADGPKARAHLLREAWITGRLEHPNIVPVHDVREGPEGAPQILLKRIQGVSWAELLAEPDALEPYLQGAEPLNWHVRALIAVCNAVDFAHSRGVLHRDIKPENVMVGAFGEVTLLDWGIAARLDEQGRVPPPKGAGHIVGTPAYLAPEMVGRMPQTTATDVYLLGAVLHELLTGHPPNQGSSLQEMLACLMRSPTLPVHPLAPLCRRALQLEVGPRPTVAAFRRELERFLELGAVEELIEASAARLEAARGKILREVDENEIMEDLSAARFGLAQALEALPEHELARAKLNEAAHVSARWALSRGAPQIAALQLRSALEPDPTLQAEIEAAIQEQEARAARLTELQRDLDPGLGLRTRRVASLVVLGIATLLSIGMSFAPMRFSYGLFSGTSVVLLVLMIGFRWASRDALFANAYNRKLAAAVLALPTLQLLIDYGGWARGWPAEQTHSLLMITAASSFGFMGLLLDRRFLSMAACWTALWIASPAWPERVYAFHGVGTFSTVVLMLWMLREGGLNRDQAGSSTTAVP
ncbi:MAG: protein kinase [Alphaproteobacteria bacterium]|nr:protein kinase [Alphaproteobacteria bacterium]